MAKTRLRVGDPHGTDYSDYEIVSALNDAIWMLWIALAENHSSIPRTKTEITLANGEATLPNDFYSLVSVSGAAVDGFVLRGEADRAELVYNRAPPMMTATGGDIAFSDGDTACLDTDPLVSGLDLAAPALGLDLVSAAAEIVKGRTEAGAAIAGAAARRISQKREYARVPNKRPFR